MGVLTTLGTYLLTDKSVKIAENQYFMLLDIQRISALSELKSEPKKMLQRLKTLQKIKIDGYVKFFETSIAKDIEFVDKIIADQITANAKDAATAAKAKANAILDAEARASAAAKEGVNRNTIFHQACGGYIHGKGYTICP